MALSWQDYAKANEITLARGGGGVWPPLRGACTSETGIWRRSRSTPATWMLVPLSLSAGYVAIAGISSPQPPGQHDDDPWRYGPGRHSIAIPIGSGAALTYCTLAPMQSPRCVIRIHGRSFPSVYFFIDTCCVGAACLQDCGGVKKGTNVTRRQERRR
ncbi:hypothetical protein LZ32DRAFT_152272 [Colletotrichum eremochloae]|nr:hypothetical protein LZ32DRAFT_152272 [Colletotrichum eremochloae]